MAASKSEKSENISAKDENEFCNCNVIHEDVVNYVRERMLEQMQFEKLSMFFKAISDETRIKILYSLSRSKMCVCDLAALLGMTASAISHQLRVLRQAELVRSEKQGNFATEIPRKCECRDIICHLSQAVTVQFIQFRIGYTIAADIRFTVRLGRVRPEIACLAQVVVFVSAWWRFIFHHNRKIVGVQSLVCLL